MRVFNLVRWPWRFWVLAVFAFAFAGLFSISALLNARTDSETRTPSGPSQEDIARPNQEPSPDPATAAAVALAQYSLDALLARQSQTLAQAMARYSLKARRPPPPHFDRWFKFARENKCLIDDYDQIQRDFEPFYQLALDQPAYFRNMVDKGRSMLLQETNGLSAKKQAAIGLTVIGIKDGQLQLPRYRGTWFYNELPRTLRRFAYFLPDLELFLNGRDEPRVVFNFREPGALNAVSKLKDPNPFHISPRPTDIFFKSQSGCNLSSNADGFVSDESADIPFLLSSSSSDFTTDLWPLLSMTKLSPCFSDILFPGDYYYRVSRWSLKLRANDIAWSDKKPQLYWRGTSNGGHIIGDNYRFFPRFRLIDIARNHSDLIDAKMTRFAEGHCTAECDRKGIIKKYNITGPRSPKEDVYHYKYLLDVDGNTFSGRFLSLLRSGSLVFKEYFNDWIRPYEHYIPVKPDLSNLVEKIDWALAHEEEAHRIQETGKLFAEHVMTDAQNDCYFAAVLLEWARLQSYARSGP
ncbi:glycosyl transferase family 90-domain-containing protein [Mycena maculata]|uniref:Glycosyl transferase family 90-domain-containing protein n=1 Tax=Mycena maculata TaxID=230809 RepID=A0AAD7JAD1_9AGAR|nr:glycosyl transferase family 90-domain-containing protein [Mycena maculata]